APSPALPPPSVASASPTAPKPMTRRCCCLEEPDATQTLVIPSDERGIPRSGRLRSSRGTMPLLLPLLFPAHCLLLTAYCHQKLPSDNLNLAFPCSVKLTVAPNVPSGVGANAPIEMLWCVSQPLAPKSKRPAWYHAATDGRKLRKSSRGMRY